MEVARCSTVVTALSTVVTALSWATCEPTAPALGSSCELWQHCHGLQSGHTAAELGVGVGRLGVGVGRPSHLDLDLEQGGSVGCAVGRCCSC